MTVAAVVVCHNSDISGLNETLETISQQQDVTFRTFVASRTEKSHATGSYSHLKLTQTTFEDSIAELLPLLTDFEWVWFLTPGQLAHHNALAELLKTAESSATAAIIAPKIMQLEAGDVIDQFGLTLTPRSSLHHIVRSELDQAQHDNLQDVLGVCLEGSIVSVDKVTKNGGAKTSLDSLAADLELAIRLRLRGMRVLVAPSAKIRGSSAERRSPRTADLQLKLFYYSPLKSLIFWLLLPLLVIAESLWLMLRKQPERVLGELSAGFTVFATAAKIWIARKSLKPGERRNLKTLSSLYATKTEVRHSRELRNYLEPETQAIAPNSQVGESYGLVSSGAIWVATGLLLVSWRYFPLGQDLSGEALLPLGDSWLNVFTATGSGFQNIGTGFYAPSDPFNWLLLALGSLTFWSPGLSVALLFFFSKSLAFAAAFKAASLFANRIWVATVAALVYAFWPMFTVAQSEARLPQVVSHLLIPALLFSAAKAVGYKGAVQTKPANWAYTAAAALSAATISICSPSLTLLLALALAALAIAKYKKFGYLVWIPVPVLALWLPTIWYRVFELQQPLALLADPSLPLSSKQLDGLNLIITSSEFNLFFACSLAALGLIALLAFVSQRVLAAAVLFSVGLTSLVAAWLFQQVRFVGNPVVGQTGQEWVNGSPHALLSVIALVFSLLIATALDELKWARAAAILALPAVATLGLAALLAPSSITFTDGRVVPALVLAEARQSSALKMLVLRPEGDGRYSATIVSNDGIHLADLNTSYRFALARSDFAQLAQTSADLISASPGDLGERLRKLSIGYVLVPASDSSSGRELVSNLESVVGLTSIGQTDFGRLWRVAGIRELPTEATSTQDLWSITKAVQLLVLTLFVLLAIPNRRRETALTQSSEADSFIEEDAGE